MHVVGSRYVVLLIGTLLTLLLLLLVAGSYVIVVRNVHQLEQQTAIGDVHRSLNALKYSEETLGVTVGDWSSWDDTYRFTGGEATNYPDASLQPEGLANLKINAVLFISPQGRIVEGRMIDAEGTPVPLIPSLARNVTINSPLLCHQDENRVVTGLLSLPEGPMLVAARPILTSGRTGPLRGTLVMGYFPNRERLDSIATLVGVRLEIVTAETNALGDAAAAMTALGKSADPYVAIRGRDLISTSVVFDDMHHSRSLILRANATRDVRRPMSSWHARTNWPWYCWT